MQDECVHWKSARICPDPREPEVVEILWDCVFNLNFIANRDAARFADQTGAAVTELTTTVLDVGEMRAALPQQKERLIEHG